MGLKPHFDFALVIGIADINLVVDAVPDKSVRAFTERFAVT